MDAYEATQAAVAELSAGGNSDSPPETTPAPSTPETTAAPATQESPAEQKPEPQSPLEDQGPVPLPRHKAVLENTRKEYEAKLEKLKWAEGLDPASLQDKLRMVEIAEADPELFLTRYERYLANNPATAHIIEARRKAVTPPVPPKEDPVPLPDVDLEDGRRVYSDTQLMALLDWHTKQITQQFKPVADKVQGDELFRQQLEKHRVALADARANWPGFKENEGDIAEYLKVDGRRTLDTAYRAVVIPKLKAERIALEKQLREEIIKELNSKPTANTETPAAPAATPPKDYKGMATADIVAEAYRDLKRR